MAVFYLRHTPIGKTTHARGTAAANARYIMRRKAAELTHAERMPWDWVEVQMYLHRHERESRKNARVCDKLILNLPRELDLHANFRLVREYLEKVSEGRAPYLFTIHTDKDGHPHAHVIFIDRDPETDRRVFGTSSQGSTYRLRMMWEQAANEALREAGHTQQISRWGKHVEQRQAAERKTLCEPPREVPRPAPERPLKSVAEAAPVVHISQPEPETEPVEKPPMAEIIELKPRITNDLEDAWQKSVRLTLDTDTELSQLRACVSARDDYRKTYAQAQADFRRVETQLADAVKRNEDDRKNQFKAWAEFKKFRRITGKLRGFRIQLGKWTYESAQRQRSRSAKENYDYFCDRLEDSIKRVERLRVAENDIRERLDGLEQGGEEFKKTLAVYGTDEDIKDAETMMRATISYEAQRLNAYEVTEAHLKGLLTDAENARLQTILRIQRQHLLEKQADGYGH